MNTLASRHPVQLVLGGIMLAEQMATTRRQLTLAALCDSAIDWAHDARDVVVEIVRDAGNAALLVEEIARDGRITPAEAAQMRRVLQEIETEAREGKVI